MSPRIGVIVRCFNEEAHIGRLLAGIAHQTLQPDECVVVDSGSTDATVSIAQAFGAKVVSVSPAEFSFGRALNIGIQACTCDITVFASAHVYPIYDSWLDRLVKPFEKDTVALAYGRQRTPPNGRFSEQRLLEQWFPLQSSQGARDPFCNNANAAIRRSVWEALPFDEELTGLEDLDWGKRAIELGHLVAYAADAPVVHVHAESFGQVVNRYRREAIAHKRIYEEQTVGMSDAALLAFANIIGDYRAAARAGSLLRNLIDIPSFRAAQFLGTYQGFAQAGPITDVLRRRFYYPAAQSEPGSEERTQALGRPIDYERDAVAAWSPQT